LALDAHLMTCRACRTEAAAMHADADRLRALRPVPPPAWVIHSIGRRRRPAALVVAFVLLVISGALAAAFAGSIVQLPVLVDASPSPSHRAPPATYPAVLLNTAVRVTASEIVLRQVPSSAGVEIARASRGAVLVTGSALRVRADGFDWYHAALVSATDPVPPLPDSLRDEDGPSGWIAIGSDVEAFATPVEPRCPSEAEFENVAAMLEAERLACFGGATIELDGTFTCPSCDGSVAGVYEPAWLASPTSAALLGPGGVSGPSLALQFVPDGPAIPGEGSSISVRGHFDDPAASGCRLSLTMPGDPEATLSPVDTDSVVLLCRQRFVVESYEVNAAP
jgi:hypothetical protein